MRFVNRARLARPVSGVVEGLVAELGLQAVPLGHVARVEDDAVDRRHVEQVGHARLGVPPRAIGVAQTELAHARGAGLRGHDDGIRR